MSLDNTHVDYTYKEYVEKLNQLHNERVNQPNNHPRFAKFEDRLEKTDLTEDQVKQIMKGKVHCLLPTLSIAVSDSYPVASLAF